MIPIWLVRHGEAAASWGEHPDPGLSDLGRQQAESAAQELLATLPGDVVLVTSPKARAQETAEPLASRLGLDVRVDAAFQEVQAPVPLPERTQWLRGFMQSSWGGQPASLWEWRQSIVEGLLEVQQPTVIFSHFLVINTVVAAIKQAPQTVHLWPDNGSVHKFLLADGALSIETLGREMNTRIN